MRAIQFFKVSLSVDVVGISLPTVTYVSLYGLERNISEYLAYLVATAVFSFLFTRHVVTSSPYNIEQRDAVVNGSKMERDMSALVVLIPVIFALISTASILLITNPLPKVGWMLITLSAYLGHSLEATLRLR